MKLTLNVQVYVRDNQGGAATTAISYLAFQGTPAITTNMGDFKRVSPLLYTLPLPLHSPTALHSALLLAHAHTHTRTLAPFS